MAGEGRAAGDLLALRLEAKPYSFDFFQAVRRMECAYRDLPRMGEGRRPREDPVRFSQEPSLAFSPCTVAAYVRRGEGPAARLFVNFAGLLGPNGPLPLHLTAYARDRERNHGDATFARFLDMFNHRMVALFYRAWASTQQAVSHDRREGDRFTRYYLSLFGLGMPSLRDRDAVADVAKVHYSGRLVCRTRHAEGLQAILQDYFRLPVVIRQFMGQWLDLPDGCKCRLGESPDTGLLGRTTIVGSRFWECQQTFRIRMGPMTFLEFERLLPGGDSLRRLVDWVRNYTGDELRWDAQLVLKAEEVPRIELGRGGRLGWTTWLRSRPFERDADDLVLRPVAG